MGPVETGAQATGAAPAAGADAGSASGLARAGPRETSGPKRLYLVKEGEMIAGVCNGLAAYFSVDPTIVRLIFVVLLVLSSGLFAIAYLVLMFVVPTAKTAEERAAARGLPFNAQELVEQAKRHYADIKDSHQRWRDKRRRNKERTFWRPKDPHGYEGPQSRPFDRPQPGYGAQVAAGIVLPLISVISAVLTVACVITLVFAPDHGRNPGLEPADGRAAVGRESRGGRRLRDASPCPCAPCATRPTRRWVRAAAGSYSGTACCGWRS